MNLGEISEARGEFDKAYSTYTEYLQLFSSCGDEVSIACCAELITGHKARNNEPHEAAFLLGAAERIHADTEVPIQPHNLERVNQVIETVRRALEPEDFRKRFVIEPSPDISTTVQMSH